MKLRIYSIIGVLLCVGGIGFGLWRAANPRYLPGKPINCSLLDILPRDTALAVELRSYSVMKQYLDESPFYTGLIATQAYNDFIDSSRIQYWKKMLYDIGTAIEYDFSNSDAEFLFSTRGVVAAVPDFVFISESPELPAPLWSLISNRNLKQIQRHSSTFRRCPVIQCTLTAVDMTLFVSYFDGIVICTASESVHHKVLTRYFRAQRGRFLRRAVLEDMTVSPFATIYCQPKTMPHTDFLIPFLSKRTHLTASLALSREWTIYFSANDGRVPRSMPFSDFRFSGSALPSEVMGMFTGAGVWRTWLEHSLQRGESRTTGMNTAALLNAIRTQCEDTAGIVFWAPTVNNYEVLPEVVGWWELTGEWDPDTVMDMCGSLFRRSFRGLTSLQEILCESGSIYYFDDFSASGRRFSPCFMYKDNRVLFSLALSRLEKLIYNSSALDRALTCGEIEANHPWVAACIKPAISLYAVDLFRYYAAQDASISEEDIDSVIAPLAAVMANIVLIEIESHDLGAVTRGRARIIFY